MERRHFAHPPKIARAWQLDAILRFDPSRAVGHDQDAIGQADRFLDVVGDEHDALAVVGPEPDQLVAHQDLGLRVERSDNDADYVTPHDMLAELREDNKQLTTFMRETHTLCDEHEDVASASLLENWIDEAERRTWFLFEATRKPLSGGD